MKHYSPATGGFYDKDVHGKNIPGDACDIEDEEWQALLAAQSQGKCIVANADGRPIAIVNAPSEKGRAANLIRRRNKALTDTDALVARHRDELELELPITLTPDTYRALQKWRAALRDITKAPCFPDVDLPAKPDGL